MSCNIISLKDYIKIKANNNNKKQIELQKAVEELEVKLGLGEDKLLVMEDTTALTVANYLLDTNNDIVSALQNLKSALDILGFEEVAESECEEIFGRQK